jgi:hypothetical protein
MSEAVFASHASETLWAAWTLKLPKMKAIKNAQS